MTSSVSPSTDALLRAWLTIEVLSPQPMPKKSEVEQLEQRWFENHEDAAPWTNPRHDRTEKESAVYWVLYLGQLNLKKAAETLLHAFPDDNSDEHINMRGELPLAALVLDAKGHIVPEKGIITSFAWGLGKVHQGSLQELAEFLSEGERLLSNLKSELQDNSDVTPVTASSIAAGLAWLNEALAIPEGHARLVWGCTRVGVKSKHPEPPDPNLLNSFFIDDLVKLQRAHSEDNVGPGLNAYLRGNQPETRRDIVRNQEALEQLLEPQAYPAGRWPGKGRHPLFLMQQAAVNHATTTLQDSGLVGVNGPPGTGKTTLLRDVIAAIVFKRAMALAAYADPAKAFTDATPSGPSGEKRDRRFKIDSKLLGYEIVVASMNNNAVENISREIPSITAVADDADPAIRYFSLLADWIATPHKTPHEKAPIEQGKHWGLVAAVLGNMTNRKNFVEDFWWNKNYGFMNYLGSIIGRAETPNELTQHEHPPSSHREALARWRQIRNDFNEKVARCTALLTKLQQGHNAIKMDSGVIPELEKFQTEYAAVEKKVALLNQELALLKQQHGNMQQAHKECINERDAIKELKPSWSFMPFRRSTFHDWQKKLEQAITETNAAKERVRTSKTIGDKTNASRAAARAQEKTIKDQMRPLLKRRELLRHSIESTRQLAGKNILDNIFWQQPTDILQKSAPWSNPELDRARDDLFAASLALQQAFIHAAAEPLRSNLFAMMKWLKEGTPGFDIKDMGPSLWASLFLVVPVISTTFPSLGRLFAATGREEIGWLLVDEAGQAPPQAAAGSIWRAKRSVIVGDPLQIEPVVPLPDRLVASIFKTYGVQHEYWAAPWVCASDGLVSQGRRARQ